MRGGRRLSGRREEMGEGREEVGEAPAKLFCLVLCPLLLLESVILSLQHGHASSG